MIALIPFSSRSCLSICPDAIGIPGLRQDRRVLEQTGRASWYPVFASGYDILLSYMIGSKMLLAM